MNTTCSYCGAEIPEGETTCPSCGKDINETRSTTDTISQSYTEPESEDEFPSSDTWLLPHIPYFYIAVIVVRYGLRFTAGINLPCVSILFTIIACILAKEIQKKLPKEKWNKAAHLNNLGFYISILLIIIWIIVNQETEITKQTLRIFVIVQILMQFLPPICTGIYISREKTVCSPEVETPQPQPYLVCSRCGAKLPLKTDTCPTCGKAMTIAEVYYPESELEPEPQPEQEPKPKPEPEPESFSEEDEMDLDEADNDEDDF